LIENTFDRKRISVHSKPKLKVNFVKTVEFAKVIIHSNPKTQ